MAFRDGPFQDIRLPLTWAAIVATVLAILVAAALLVSDRKDAISSALGHGPMRDAFDEVVEPMDAVLAAPVRWVGDGVDYVEGYFFAVAENRRLKQKLAELQAWRDEAIALKNINDRYETLLKLKTEPPVPMVTGRAVMDARGPFSNARLLDVGSEAGVKVGNPAVNENGVLGRIVGVTNGASRLLLLTDVESRTPVLVDRTNARAILSGDGGPYPKLQYLRGREPVKNGDLILTSGDGGLFPRGLPVGVAVQDLKGDWRVRLFSDQGAIDYVRVLIYQDFSQLVNPTSLSNSEVPPLNAPEKAEIEAALHPPPPPPTPANAAKTPGTPAAKMPGAATAPAAATSPAATAAKPAAAQSAKSKTHGKDKKGAHKGGKDDKAAGSHHKSLKALLEKFGLGGHHQ